MTAPDQTATPDDDTEYLIDVLAHSIGQRLGYPIPVDTE